MQTKKEVLVLLQALDNIQFIEKSLKKNIILNDCNFDYEIGCIDTFMCSTTSKLVADVLDKRDVGKERGCLFLIQLLLIRYNPKDGRSVQDAMDTLFSLSEEDFKNMDNNADNLNKDFCKWYRDQTYFCKYWPSFLEKDKLAEFFIWLCEEKHIVDPDVELFYAVFKDDVELVKKALAKGADKTVTDRMLIRKYQTEYNEFISLLNQ